MNNQTIRRTGLMEKSLLLSLSSLVLHPLRSLKGQWNIDATAPTRSHSPLLQYLSLPSTVEVQTNLVTTFSPFYLFFLLFAYPLL